MGFLTNPRFFIELKLRYKTDEFESCCSGAERVLLAYHNIPEESTTIDRLDKTRLFEQTINIVVNKVVANKGMIIFMINMIITIILLIIKVVANRAGE